MLSQLRSVIEDQYTLARVYFASVVGMLLFESLLQLPQYLSHLGKRKGSSSQTQKPSPHSFPAVFVHKLRTLPPFLPAIITSHRITYLLRLLVFIGLNILFSWTRLKYSTDYKLAGWLCIANGGLTLLISPRGTNLLSLLLRIPSETLLIYHRWCGRATVIHGTIHFGLNVSQFIRTEQLDVVLGEMRIQVGVAAFVVLCILFISSLAIVRRKAFEVFFYVHFLFIAFVIGACIHATHGPEFILPGTALWVVDRAVRTYMSWRYVGIRSAKSYKGDVTKFILEGVKAPTPGTRVYVLFPGASFNWHPFTVSPNVASGIEGDENSAMIAVRGLGSWTKSVQKLAVTDAGGSENYELATKIRVRVDGPYGVGSTNWGLRPVTILIAGGIGITPGIGIATYVIRNAAALGSKQHIYLLWVVKDESHIAWFSDELTVLANEAKRTGVTFDVTIHVTGKGRQPSAETKDISIDDMHRLNSEEAVTPQENSWQTVSGRPHLPTWFADVNVKHPGFGGAVNVCGPRPLVLETRRAALKVSSKSGLFVVEEEIFEV